MDRLNLTGFWIGSYWYHQPDQPVVPFIANLDEVSESISGSMSEPNTMGESSDRLEAFVRGGRKGCSVEFAKVYDGASDAAHRVDYSGHLSEDGLELAGIWDFEDWTGGFRMNRQAVANDEVDERQESEVEAHNKIKAF